MYEEDRCVRHLRMEDSVFYGDVRMLIAFDYEPITASSVDRFDRLSSSLY